jgi:hypothetical protein
MKGVQAYQGDSEHEVILEKLHIIQIQTIRRKAQVRFISLTLFTAGRSPKAVPCLEFDCLFVYHKMAQFLSSFFFMEGGPQAMKIIFESKTLFLK